jgi:ferric-dicitrate binding protein FerR (iron transport regulator)
MNESLDDLIQRALDGDVNAEERSRLEVRLTADPAARQRFDELSRVFQALGAARLEDSPAGMRDGVLRAIRVATPARAQAPARAGRPAFSWLRIVLPAAAGVVAAVVLFSSWQGTPLKPAGDVTGTMSGARSTDGLRLGTGTHSVLVHWNPSESGFQLRIQTGDAPVHVTLESLTPGARLSMAGQGLPTPSSSIEAPLPANALVIAEGTAPDRRANIRVRVTLPDGQLATGEVRLQGLRSSQ